MLHKEIDTFLSGLTTSVITAERRVHLQVLIDYIQGKRNNNQVANLNFICTHNSRRSQFSQVWAKVAAYKNNIAINSFSGGVERTAFNERAVASLKRSGFKIESEGSRNPNYSVSYSKDEDPISAFSKLFDDALNPSTNFAAIMTCSHADENCPFIPGAKKRIPIRYNDPKEFDGTSKEAEMYDERSREIAAEMMYIFLKIN